MFSFRNIDDFIPHRFETIGMLKGKRWYIDKNEFVSGLFKPKRYEFGDKKVFCANHYGELVGYILALRSGIPVCKAELAHLSKYYKNIHKFRNNGTPEEKDGCITYSKLKDGDMLKHGKLIVDIFSSKQRERFNSLTPEDSFINKADNLEVVLSAVEDRTRAFYEEKSDIPNDYVEGKVKQNKLDTIQMIVYDCLYGNNDRHDENWGMLVNDTDISLYPLYDNERVLGLYENQNIIEGALKSDNVEKTSEEILFSRMRVPGDKSKHSNYKDVLEYLMQNYTDETELALKKSLTNNTPADVERILKECEVLPECYVEFGTRMYKSRYEFAKGLYKNKKINYSTPLELPKTYTAFSTYGKKTSGEGR